jgi:hypothetical protein
VLADVQMENKGNSASEEMAKLSETVKNIYNNILCKQYSFILKFCFIFILLLVRKVSLIKHMLMTDKVIIINKLTYLKANMLCEPVGIIISWPMT